MAYDDVADAESIGDDEYYDDEYDDDEDDEEEYLFGTIPRTPGLIAFAALAVVLLLLLAALFSASFGFVGGIKSLDVTIPGQEGSYLDEKMDIKATTKTPAFGKNADGSGDLKIFYDGDIEVYSGELKFNKGIGTRTIPYADFYVDNGEYTATLSYEGFTESDTIELERTAHFIIGTQNTRDVFQTEDESTTYVRYQITLFPDDQSTTIHDALWTPGEGTIKVLYVNNEADQDNPDEWETVMLIDIKTDFRSFEYQFPGEDVQNLSSLEKFVLDFDEQKLLDEKGDGYYSFEVEFENTYGLESMGAFRDPVFAMPEDYEDPNDSSKMGSLAWIELEDD